MSAELPAQSVLDDRKDPMYENLTRLERRRPGARRPRVGAAGGLARLRREVEPDLRAHERRGRGRAAQAAGRAAGCARDPPAGLTASPC